jgi:hypothetical protein
MNQVQELVMHFIGIALMAGGGLCIAKGALSVHKQNNGADDINLAGWKSMSSWWALGGVQLASGSYMAFMRFFNAIFHYLFNF